MNKEIDSKPAEDESSLDLGITEEPLTIEIPLEIQAGLAAQFSTDSCDT